MVFEQEVGSRALVWHKKARATSSGLTRDDLYMGKDGSIKSKKMKKRGSSPALKKWRAAVAKVSKKEGQPILPKDMTGKVLESIRAEYKKMMK
tara:strand:+ start:526 stop:804 length:279 start_codon:yes stop_codon:yes gene_type:complete